MTNEFKCRNCGECCGPIPITVDELTSIRADISKMSQTEVNRLSKQKRGTFDCPLLDKDSKKCSVYNARPRICRMYGFYAGLACPHNDNKLKPRKEGHRNMFSSKYAGVMGINIGWPEFTKGEE